MTPTSPQQAETGQGDSNPMSEAVEVSGDPVEEDQRWTICVCPKCRVQIEPNKGGWACGNGHFGPMLKPEWVEVIPARSRDEALSRALAAEAERDTWKRAYRGASENCEAAEQRVEEAIAHFEREATYAGYVPPKVRAAYRACADFLRGARQ